MSQWLQTFFDVTARKPSGWLGKLLYRKPIGHYGFFRVAIERLQLQPEDVFLEIGCGGGALLDAYAHQLAYAVKRCGGGCFLEWISHNQSNR
jgi:tRNA G46 methylase TrmB